MVSPPWPRFTTRTGEPSRLASAAAYVCTNGVQLHAAPEVTESPRPTTRPGLGAAEVPEEVSGGVGVVGGAEVTPPEGESVEVGAARAVCVVWLVPTTAPTATRRAISTAAAAIIRTGVKRTRAG